MYNTIYKYILIVTPSSFETSPPKFLHSLLFLDYLFSKFLEKNDNYIYQRKERMSRDNEPHTDLEYNQRCISKPMNAL